MDMLYIMVYGIVCILGLVSIPTLLIVFHYREHRLNKKIELLNHMIDKDYETKNVDINNI